MSSSPKAALCRFQVVDELKKVPVTESVAIGIDLGGSQPNVHFEWKLIQLLRIATEKTRRASNARRAIEVSIVVRSRQFGAHVAEVRRLPSVRSAA